MHKWCTYIFTDDYKVKTILIYSETVCIPTRVICTLFVFKYYTELLIPNKYIFVVQISKSINKKKKRAGQKFHYRIYISSQF